MIERQYEPIKVALYVDGKPLKEIKRFRFHSLNKGREIEIDIPILTEDKIIDYTKMNNVKIVQTFVKEDRPELITDEDEGLYKREYCDVTFVGMKNTITDLTSPAGVFDTYIFSCDSVSSILKIDKRSYEKIIGQRITYTGNNIEEIAKLWPDLFEKGRLVKHQYDSTGEIDLFVDTRYIITNINKLSLKVVTDYNLEEDSKNYIYKLPLYVDIIKNPKRSKIKIEA